MMTTTICAGAKKRNNNEIIIAKDVHNYAELMEKISGMKIVGKRDGWYYIDETEETSVYNEIKDENGYLADGFTSEELEMIKEHDLLMNMKIDEIATEKQIERMVEIAEKLGL